MEHKLYAATIVSIPEDDYAYGEIVGISETQERAYEIGCSAIPAGWSGTVDTYLVVMDIPVDRIMTSCAAMHTDVAVYHYNEDKSAFALVMKGGNGNFSHSAGYHKDAEEAEATARNIFGWE